MFAQDAMQANLGFVTAQTSHVEAGVYRIKYPDIQYPSLIPVDYSANSWATSVTYWSMDGAGKAKWASGKAFDVPTVGLRSEKFETSVHMSAIGYDYGLEEVNQAKMLGVNLGNEKALIARRVSEEFTDEVALNGDAEKNMKGLYDYPGVPSGAAPAAGADSPTGQTASLKWRDKTPDDIIADFNSLVLGTFVATNTTSMSDTVLLPWDSYLYLSSTPRATGSDMSILEWLVKNNVYTAKYRRPLTISGVRGLETKGAGSTGRAVAYRRAPEVLKLHVPMPFQFLPVQVQGLSYLVPGVMRLGGLDIRLPKEVRYLDGIM
ncbi:MAG: DUF2184 domain-containing protein [Methylobacterium sp.]|uniref:DUF2184 domain-containing protein n=1 Tax=Methylobacterium sp. TaxID=409 RepID=UPI0025E1CA36|nr:major capsid family protein [Methylobacterium sp.]MBX9934540.1 DUF2184 domain-containing protein [Methylobacterium sp.]